MRTSAKILGYLAAICISGTTGHATESSRNQKRIEKTTRLQIFLDNSNFGPGKIDGKEGKFSRIAVALFKRSQGQTEALAQDSDAPIDTSGLDLTSVDPVFATYVVTRNDIENVGALPADPAAQSKLKWMPYESVAEAVAEKFHCDVQFLETLNPGKCGTLKEGDQVIVPNVKPFELRAKARELDSGKAASPGNNLEKRDEKESPTDKKSRNETSEKDLSSVSLYVSTKEKMLHVYAGQKLVAAFPVSVGSQQTASPVGGWTVKTIAELPTFRYDANLLEKGERSSNFHMLPPGPNNPAGVMWIALNKDGIGIHGSSEPDLVGRDTSHGCIRLSNWDVAKLGKILKPGVPVKVE